MARNGLQDALVLPRDNLLIFFLRESEAEGLGVLGQIVLCGLLEAGLICGLAFTIGETAPDRLFAALYALGAVVLLVLQHRSLRNATVLAERMAGRFTSRLVSRARRIELLDLERIGPERLIDATTRDLATFSASQRALFNAMGSLVMTLALLLVVMALAPVVGLLMIAAGLVFARSSALREIAAGERLAASAESRLLVAGRALVEGFKELRSDERKRRDFFTREVAPAAAGIVAPRVQARRRGTGLAQAHNATVYLCAALAAFAADWLGFGGQALVVTILVLYLTGSSAFVFTAADLAAGSVAIGRLVALDAELASAATAPVALEPQTRAARRFNTLELRQVTFVYSALPGVVPAQIGPIDLQLEAGGIIFLTGGNGSGKSTLLKLLTGLYPATSGEILLDGHPVEPAVLRGLFTSVFTDFHLFERLPEGLDPARAQDLMTELGLDRAVRIEDGCFTTTALSSGQRKRLALLMAMLEDRPICALDEWAADQDPEFREIFYARLLPGLKAQGRTIIAASHDDRYFDRCDRQIEMEAGKLRAGSL